MNIYIGNFSKDVTEDDLKLAFENYGQVTSVTLIKDKFTGEPRGFAFVEMPSKKEAETAMDAIRELKGRMVVVNEARPREEFRGGRRENGGLNSRGRRGGY